ncbi:hypothetical protein KC345_g4524 [Hortaea werneckii]|nr:hypothetical protein KC345_g4524 [Hortaea werneckii]
MGFMPKALAREQPVEPYTFHFDPESAVNRIFTGWTQAPTSYEIWAGEAGVRLCDYAVESVRRALPGARVGGPEVAGGPDGEWLGKFLNHTVVGTNAVTGKDDGSPLDFFSFHAKGAPIYISRTAEIPGHLQMNASAALQNSRDAFSVISSIPELKDKPIIIGEDDPDGCAACVSDAYDYRNGLIYPSSTAEVFARNIQLAREYDVNLEGAVTWAFVFENHAFLMASQSSGEIALDAVVEESVLAESDVGVLAAFNETTETLAVMVWNHHDDDLPKPDADLTFDVTGLTEKANSGWRGWRSWREWRDCQKVKLTHYRIDDDHSNSYTKWLAIGFPTGADSRTKCRSASCRQAADA